MSKMEPAAPADLGTVAVLLPSWEPDAELLPLVESLCGRGFGALVVVDDGSGPESAALFQAVAGF